MTGAVRRWSCHPITRHLPPRVLPEAGAYRRQTHRRPSPRASSPIAASRRRRCRPRVLLEATPQSGPRALPCEGSAVKPSCPRRQEVMELVVCGLHAVPCCCLRGWPYSGLIGTPGKSDATSARERLRMVVAPTGRDRRRSMAAATARPSPRYISISASTRGGVRGRHLQHTVPSPSIHVAANHRADPHREHAPAPRASLSSLASASIIVTASACAGRAAPPD